MAKLDEMHSVEILPYSKSSVQRLSFGECFQGRNLDLVLWYQGWE